MSLWSEKLDTYMRENGLSKKQLASKMDNTPYATVKKWWQRNPSPASVEQLNLPHGATDAAPPGHEDTQP